jgi:hypothetical protein
MALPNVTMRQVQIRCMKSCRAEPFHFESWENSAAWLLCSIDADACTLSGLLLTDNALGIAPNYRQAADSYSRVIKLMSETGALPSAIDAWHAHQYCFVVTIGQSLPAFFAALVTFYLALALLRVPFVVLSSGTQLLVQMLSYTHAQT